MAQFTTSDIIGLCIEKLTERYGTMVKISTSVGDFFLKWNSSAPSDLFVKEAAGLNEMRSAENPFLVIPRVIFDKKADEFPGLLLMEYLPPSTSALGYDEKLGRGIARLHRKTAPAFGFHHSNFCGTTLQDNEWKANWPEFYAQRRIGALVKQIRNRRGMNTDEEKIYENLVSRMPGLLSHDTTPSLIHGDLWSGNYVYTANGPALIDPACYYADREMELGMMQLFGGFSPAVWESYQDEFPLPEGWKERIALYQLYHVLNHYSLFGGSYGRQALEIAGKYL
jgi:protein-ribulosamine 3-kinase